MPRILEADMEATIEADLVSSGYFKREPASYDKDLCLDPEQLFNFILLTQKDKWEEYQRQLGNRARDAFLSKVKEAIETRGTISLFRKPFPSYGVHFDLAYFKPASGMNESYREKYRNNIFSVMRQVKYSKQNEKSLDIALFLNGIPLATIELKDRMTGSGYNVNSAIRQYQNDRDPREPLFKYGRCLIHFAVDEELVYMTTKLKGGATYFLPFNKGNKGNAGNPPTDGFSTEYLWKDILARDSFLELLQHYIQESDILDEDGRPTGEKSIFFPRYHQVDCVRKIVAHAQVKGTGQQYLIQHSTGSGKSSTISWLAHQLSNLHDKDDLNVFDSIVVVTDRRILDRQLRDTIMSFEQQPGVVAGIEKGSAQLKEELEAGTKIIVSTLQKFPYIEEKMKELPGKRFAIIIDEAHSSSSGEMSKSMKKVLNFNVEDDEEEEEEKTYEDEIVEQMKMRGRRPNISYFAFTATPKPKTLELFGTKQEDGSFVPFHIYSMRQAIEENFIKDVLPNYISYNTYFKLIKKITSDPSYDKKKASALLRIFVEMSEHTIAKKTAIIVSHFVDNCMNEMKGRAKAMVVCSSRAQAVKYKIAFDKYLNDNGLPFKALVAFSGTVGMEGDRTEYSEARMNGFPEEQTAQHFKENHYKFLIVANKFQYGFDQPLLYAMYLNKKIQGVNAVQTLSRLNRVYPGKKNPITLDFINPPKAIQDAFQDFYGGVTLEEGSDPDKLYSLKMALEEFHFYTGGEVEEFAKVFFAKNFQQERLVPILIPVLERYGKAGKKEREQFREILKAYLRSYSFLSQLIPFADPALEKLYVFGKILLRKLPYEIERLPKEVLQQVDLDSIKIQYLNQGIKVKPGEGGVFQPGDQFPMVKDPSEFIEPLSVIIKAINEKYATDFSEKDKILAGSLLSRLKTDAELKEAVRNDNPKENLWYAFERKFNTELQGMIEENFDFYKRLNNDSGVKAEMMKLMFSSLHESLKREVGSSADR